jgi:hypothetical protein
VSLEGFGSEFDFFFFFFVGREEGVPRCRNPWTICSLVGCSLRTDGGDGRECNGCLRLGVGLYGEGGGGYGWTCWTEELFC